MTAVLKRYDQAELMDKQRLSELLAKYHNNTLTYSEKQELDEWFHSLQHPDSTTGKEADEAFRQEMLHEFRARFPYPASSTAPRRVGRRILAAAAVVTGLFIGGAYYLLQTGHPKQPAIPMTSGIASNRKTIMEKDSIHGINHAMLILEDGSSINLDESHTGLLVERGGMKAVKADDSTVKYLGFGKMTETVYHTIKTPRGRQYRLSLPDGSMVWLNVDAAIRYPVAFAGAERRVEVSGEAYFEIAKDMSRPFIVSIDGKEEVKVLGTHFNINAYKESGPAVVTLLEGAVNVSERKFNVTLKPGEQSSFSSKGFRVKKANIEQVMAWKMGFLDFDALPLDAVMQEISRWYDIDILYKELPDHPIALGGRISKNLPLSKVLNMLEAYGVHAQLSNTKKQVIISTR
ncbi:MAG: FecR domain-containing protein [Chitinophagaceae bacterium]|nr:FecR domain-containing protein [Chitinophagaceae bacterium]